MTSWREIVEERAVGVCTDLTEKEAFDALDLLRNEGFRTTATLVSGIDVEIEVGGVFYHGLSGTRKFIEDVKYQLYPIYRKMDRISDELTRKRLEIDKHLSQNKKFHSRNSVSDKVNEAIALFEEMYANYEKLMGPQTPDYKKSIGLKHRLGEIKSRAELCAKNYDEMLEDRDPEGASKKYGEVLSNLVAHIPARPSKTFSLGGLQIEIYEGARYYLGDISSFREKYENDRRARLLHLAKGSKAVVEAISILDDLGFRGAQSLLMQARLEKTKT